MQRTLIAGWQAHHDNVFRKLAVWLRSNQLDDLVVDDARLWCNKQNKNENMS